jgi:hypothetical protein
MKKRLPIRPFLPLFFFALAASVAVAQEASETEDGGEKPVAYMQILNGIAPHRVSVALNGEVLYPQLGPGARISSFAVRQPQMQVTVTKLEGGEQKTFNLDFAKPGYYTLCLIGDFSKLSPVSGADGVMKENYKVAAPLLPNSPSGGDKVNVRLVNGLTDAPVRLSKGSEILCEAAPGKVAVAEALSAADLLLQATDGRAKTDLAIAQEPPARNITVVFYQGEDRLRFRAMTEAQAGGKSVE